MIYFAPEGAVTVLFMYNEINNLYPEDREEILRLLNLSRHNPPALEDIWYLMDKVWDGLGCNNKNLDYDKITKFYAHPVWVLNGIFIEHHELSMEHRKAIASFINSKEEIKSVIDYGGGWGTLARLIIKSNPSISVDLFDDYPNKYVLKMLENLENIKFIDTIDHEYDCLISTDVLEHVQDPLKTLERMIKITKDGGYLIIANNFYPVIKCHLPSKFYLRYTFNFFTRLMGLTKIGRCQGSHATVYKKKKVKEQSWLVIRFCEILSRSIFFIYSILKK